MDRNIPKEEIRRRRILNIAKWGLAAAVITGGVIWALNSLQSGVKRSSLDFCRVDNGTIEASISAYGKVVPAFEEVINSPINTRIVEVYRRSGDSVDVGTPLLKLDLQSIENDYRNLLDEEKMKQYQMEQMIVNTRTALSDMALQIRISEMKLGRLLADYHNERHLDSLGAGTADQVRQAEMAYTTARLELEQLKQRYATEQQVKAADMKVKQLELEIFRKGMEETRRTLEDARLKSPHKAVLTYINTQVGARVAQGEQIAVVADLDHFKIECEIADQYAGRVRTGGKALVKVNRQVLDGTIIQVEPLSKDGVNRFIVQTDEEHNSLLRSGQKADIYVVQTVRENAVRIRNASFYTGPGEYELFVEEEENRLVKRKVRLGECDFDHVEVVEGLRPGEQAVISDMSAYGKNPMLKIK